MPELPRHRRARAGERIHAITVTAVGRSAQGASHAVHLVAGLSIVGLVLMADLLVDAAVRTAAEPSIAVAGDLLRLTPSRNEGVAFGLLSGAGSVVIILLTGLVLGAAIASVRRARGLWLRTAIWLVLAGGVANLFERVVNGGVLDYVDVGLGSARWPTFNIADVAISLAVVALAASVATQRGPSSIRGTSGTGRP